MNNEIKGQKLGVAFVREMPLPPYQTWIPVPYYTSLIGADETKYYIGKRQDRPVDIAAIKSYSTFSISVPKEIQMDEAVFLDWEGNYFIGKKDSLELPEKREIIHSNLDWSFVAIFIPSIVNKYKPSQDKIYEGQYRAAC